MKPAKGSRRPWSIWVFAAAFLAAALQDYLFWLTQIEVAQQIYELRWPWNGWNRDWTIVALSATLSIAFIPVAWICLFASQIARWLVTAFGALELLGVLQKLWLWISADMGFGVGYFINPGLILIAILCLFLPPSNRWFSPDQEVSPAIFE